MSKPTNFIDKEFVEVEGGHYDEYGFYHSPNGSFWDADGFYFNKDGFDRHGGYYDDDWKYVPGECWDEKKQSYPNDLDDNYDEEGEEFDEIDEDDIFDKINYENNKEKLKYEEDVNSVQKNEIKEEKKESVPENKTTQQKPTNNVGGLKGLLSSSGTTQNKSRPQTASLRGGKK